MNEPSFSYKTRQEALAKFASETFDILVVGGGITGAGVARDARLRGLRTALVERSDFGSGTSSKSSKLVHGGFRYLEQYDFGLVFESTAERALLMKRAPHLVRPMPFFFPVYREGRLSPFKIRLGMWLYDLLAIFRNYRVHKKLGPRETAKREPALKQDGLQAVMRYYDCVTNDARLTLENVEDAARAGASVANYTEFVRPLRTEDGTIRGGVLRNLIDGEEIEIQARVIIRALGPWTDKVPMAPGGTDPRMIRPTKGVHLVVPGSRLPLHNAIVIEATDGRILFTIPWEENVIIGTTDTDFHGDADHVVATREDVDYLLSTTNTYFPEVALTHADVISTWAGLRPLVQDEVNSPYDTSREHTIVTDPDGVITIAGGKLTTYRRMAAEGVEAALKILPGTVVRDATPSDTKSRPLPGAESFNLSKDGEEVVGQLTRPPFSLKTSHARRMLRDLGGRWSQVAERLAADPATHEIFDAAHPVTRAEVSHAVENEMAIRLEDVMIRRTHLFYHLPDQGASIAENIASQMASALGWDPSRKEAEIHRYRALIQESRAWRTETTTP